MKIEISQIVLNFDMHELKEFMIETSFKLNLILSAKVLMGHSLTT